MGIAVVLKKMDTSESLAVGFRLLVVLLVVKNDLCYSDTLIGPGTLRVACFLDL